MAEAIRPRRAWGSFIVRLLMLLSLSFAMMSRPALAQSILRDAETESLFHDMSAPLVEAAGLRPKDVEIVLIHDKSINAFVAGGQVVYVHSGLIAAADNANEVQGVIAHELGHIAGGHVVRFGEGMKMATGIMLLSLLLGAAAMAAGAGEAGAGILAAGQQAALGKFLAFSRVQESSADQAGASYLHKAGISGRGSIAFFKRLQNQEFRLAIPQEDSYGRTHPLSGERIQILENAYKNDAAWNTKTDPALEDRFQRVKAKLAGFVEDPRTTLIRYPETDKSVPARYARAYAWHKSAYPDRSMAEVDSLLRDRPNDPYFLELKGQVLLESGHPEEALASLRDAVSRAPDQPLISALFGHALIATEKPDNFPEAKKVLRSAIGRDNSNPFAWYQLGIVYDREGDRGRAALATAERYNLEGVPRLALANAEHAMQNIARGTPDWIRAQDIAMVSRTAISREGKKGDGVK
ncbi:M48 family metalloprotease [Sphingosinicella rhizophila]|uniref:M48 family metalloprotease n=1 Tax=Sphingosinicella rhizophila TaxID=3050082 RepID=A0ABU3Q7V0_9SPHN|nr:M48 family metalloprotease [Sphingosinicella sp. GR2756]MDT9599053.1 M48 family metalloprotease [Sphingosinicella sp. GR2756]